MRIEGYGLKQISVKAFYDLFTIVDMRFVCGLGNCATSLLRSNCCACRRELEVLQALQQNIPAAVKQFATWKRCKHCRVRKFSPTSAIGANEGACHPIPMKYLRVTVRVELLKDDVHRILGQESLAPTRFRVQQ